MESMSVLRAIIRDMLKCEVSSSQYSTDNTGAYSPFKRLRLKPLSAQNTSNSKEERASVFPEVTFSLMKTGFFTALSAFSRIGVFCAATGSSTSTSPEV